MASNPGILPFIFISGILFSNSTFGTLPSIFKSDLGILISTFGTCPFKSIPDISELIPIPGILPSILGILPFISIFGEFNPTEALGRFTFFPFKLISGESKPISGDLILMPLIFWSRSNFLFASIPTLISELIFGISGFFIFPSIFKSPLTFGTFIFFFPGITPEKINSPFSAFILISGCFILGIFASILTLLLSNLGISTLPFKSTSPGFNSIFGALMFFPGISPFNSKRGSFNLGPFTFISVEGTFIPGLLILTSKSVPILGPFISNFGFLISRFPFPGISPVILVSVRFAFIFISFFRVLSFVPIITPVKSSYISGVLIFNFLSILVENFISGFNSFISGILILSFIFILVSILPFFNSTFGILPSISIFFEPFKPISISLFFKSISFFKPFIFPSIIPEKLGSCSGILIWGILPWILILGSLIFGIFISPFKSALIPPSIFLFKFNSGFWILLSKFKLKSGFLIFKSFPFISIFALISLLGIFKFPSGISPFISTSKGFIFIPFFSISIFGFSMLSFDSGNLTEALGTFILFFKSKSLSILISPPWIFKLGFFISNFDL